MSCGSSSGRLVWESLGPFSSFPSCAVVFGASVGSEEWVSKHPIYSHCLFIHSHQAPTSFSFPFQTLFWGNWLSRRAWPVPVVFQHHSALHSAVMCSRTSWKFVPVVVLSLGRGQSPGIVWITYIKSRWLAEFWYLVYYLHDGVNWEVSSLHRLFVIQIAWFSAGKLYGDTDYLEERHRHRFEVRMWACSFCYSAKKGMERPAQWVFCPTRWIQSWRSAWKSKAWSLLAKMLKAKGWRFWSWKVTG